MKIARRFALLAVLFIHKLCHCEERFCSMRRSNLKFKMLTFLGRFHPVGGDCFVGLRPSRNTCTWRTPPRLVGAGECRCDIKFLFFLVWFCQNFTWFYHAPA